MNKVDAPLTAKEVVEKIEIGDSTLRKWCLALEEQNYNFVRTTQNKRMFSDKDVFVLSQFKLLVQTKHLSIQNAAEIIATKYKEDILFSNETQVEHPLSEQLKSSSSNEALIEAKEELKAEIEQLKEFNRMLLAKLDEQQNYIDDRLNKLDERTLKRDQMLMESLKASQETKKLLLEAQEEQKKKRKGIFSFFNKD